MNGATQSVAVVGGGPAGLMAAEVLSAAGVAVHVYDAMPSVGRKFLLAGLGGLNLTHAEPAAAFASRYRERSPQVSLWLQAFGAQAVRDWAAGLGIDTFVGSSQRVFPTDMKAAPLLRAWLHRLRHPERGHPVTFHARHRWVGPPVPQAEGWALRFDTPTGPQTVQARAVVFALGGASWPRLGSDGAWQAPLQALGLPVAPLRPANCGFDVAVGERLGWSALFAQRCAGLPFKTVGLSLKTDAGERFDRVGECVATATGIEGSLVYAASALIREQIAARGRATVWLDLKPDWPLERIRQALASPRGKRSLGPWLQARLGLGPLHTTLLHELLPRDTLAQPDALAPCIKHLPLTLAAPRPVDEAISSAGGVALEALDEHLMARAHPGLFFAGEMLDWEAPTGGYLLTACLASGRLAGQGVLRFSGA